MGPTPPDRLLRGGSVIPGCPTDQKNPHRERRHNTKIKLITLLLTLTLCKAEKSAFSGQEFPLVLDSRTEIALFSWSDHGHLLFAFVPRAKADSFLNGFSPRYGGVELSMLEFEIAKLPQNSIIVWRDLAPKGINYPSKKIVDQVRQISKKYGIRVQMLSTIYDN